MDVNVFKTLFKIPDIFGDYMTDDSLISFPNSIKKLKHIEQEDINKLNGL